MSTSGNIEAILNQLLQENRTLKVLMLSVLRDKSIDDLNRYMGEVSARTKLAMQNTNDQGSIQSFKKTEVEAISMLNTLIAEKSASL